MVVRRRIGELKHVTVAQPGLLVFRARESRTASIVGAMRRDSSDGDLGHPLRGDLFVGF